MIAQLICQEHYAAATPIFHRCPLLLRLHNNKQRIFCIFFLAHFAGCVRRRSFLIKRWPRLNNTTAAGLRSDSGAWAAFFCKRIVRSRTMFIPLIFVLMPVLLL